MLHVIFGGRGFIGQNLTKAILSMKDSVLVIDKNVWKQSWVYPQVCNHDRFNYIEADINSSSDEILFGIQQIERTGENIIVWHLAANSDISAGNDNLDIDLRDTFLTTANILKICKHLNITQLNFASSSAVYGQTHINEKGFSEDSVCQPISHYGAMKLASEALIRSSHEINLKKCLIYRFPNVVGFPATHGVVRDFILKLRADDKFLQVLGDGRQNKPYLHVEDLINAMLHLNKHYNSDKYFEIVNISSPYDNVFVSQIAEEVVRIVSPMAKILYGDTKYGWIGDMPVVNFDNRKLLDTGWTCKLTGIQAVQKTIYELIRVI